jgi:hypothetical protein
MVEDPLMTSQQGSPQTSAFICITLAGAVQLKDKPLSDVQIESVSSVSSALFSEMNEVVGKVKNESEQNSLGEVKQELDEMSDQENEDGMVSTFCQQLHF